MRETRRARGAQAALWMGALVMAGCSPATTYYHQDGELARLDRDMRHGIVAPLVCPTWSALDEQVRQEAQEQEVREHAEDLRASFTWFKDELSRRHEVLPTALDPREFCDMIDQIPIWSPSVWELTRRTGFPQRTAEIASRHGVDMVYVPVVAAQKVRCDRVDKYLDLHDCWEEEVRVGMLLFDAQGRLRWKRHALLRFGHPIDDDREELGGDPREAIRAVVGNLPTDEE